MTDRADRTDAVRFIAATPVLASLDIGRTIAFYVERLGAVAVHAEQGVYGIVALGEMWLRMARASVAALDAGSGDAGFYNAKLITARHFAERNFPDCGALRRKIEAGSEAMMAMPADAF